MSVIRRLGERVRSQDGFTMIVALGVMVVTSLLTGAVFLAVQSDAGLSRSDLDGKRAYAAAQAGLQSYLYQLNANSANSNWWQTCTNDVQRTPTSVGGSTDEAYTYHPVIDSCAVRGPIGTVVDPTTGLLRMEFRGTAGSRGQQRTIVASFRPVTPLSYLWYTVHESFDPQANASCKRADPSTDFYWSSDPPAPDCRIFWQTGDVVNGPMFSHDQLLIGGTPQLGRVGSKDAIATDANVKTVCALQRSCPAGVIRGREKPGSATVNLPSDNANLLKDASDPSHGMTFTGTTNLLIDGPTATATVCTTNVLADCQVYRNISLTKTQLLYAINASGCDPTQSPYTPQNVTYQQLAAGPAPLFYGKCGDVYVSTPVSGVNHGKYTVPLTIGSAEDVVVVGDLKDSLYASGAPSGVATLGLVAQRNVRVYHPQGSSCANTPNPDVSIDAAILTLSHSFFVDNFDCGSGNGQGFGQLHIHGSIAQQYRGAVGEAGGSGYLKDYNYDERLALLLPPYLFDLQDASWTIVRETLCSTGVPASNSASCSYTGT